MISIHVPLAGHDRVRGCTARPSVDFNPRAPCGARRSTATGSASLTQDFNPRAPCGARLEVKYTAGYVLPFQSTCPLRGTTPAWCCAARARCISIHVPLAGHDGVHEYGATIRAKFQSTCPLRGTTRLETLSRLAADYFNPRAPCGARLNTYARKLAENLISIHVPLAGHDNSRRPASSASSISIHVPLAGHDR